MNQDKSILNIVSVLTCLLKDKGQFLFSLRKWEAISYTPDTLHVMNMLGICEA